MNESGNALIIAILALIALASCGGGTGEDISALRLQVEPLPGVYVQYDSRTGIFRIGNELIERRILVNAEKNLIFTTAFINKLSGRNYVRSASEEFSFRVNGVKLSGVTGDFEYLDHELSGPGDVKELAINLQAKREEMGPLKVRLVYGIYPHMPVIRKWVEIENPGGSSVTIDSIKVESLSLLPGSDYDAEVYASPRPSTIVFDSLLGEGFITGNEAPGALKSSDVYSEGSFVSIGMKSGSQSYATEIQLAPGERFACPGVFVLLFKGDPDRARELLVKFVAEYLAWSRTQQLSIWYESIPSDVTEPEVREKIQLAAKSGAHIFCLDGGRMDKPGDWSVTGDIHLESLGKYARSMGMKFGVSLELALADADSQMVSEYPQWVVKSEDGSDYTIGGDDGAKMMCLGSEYTLYAANQIDGLVRELSLDYVKFTGQIIPDAEATGCFAEDHVHRSSAESLWYIYEGLFALCRYLHTRHPDLMVDVSLESYDPVGSSADYALLKYADVEWPF